MSDLRPSLEERVAALEATVAALTAPTGRGGTRLLSGDGDFWLLEELEERHPGGAIAYAGHAALPEGPVRWQWGRSPGALLETDWHGAAAALGALAHPVRLRLLQLVLTGVVSTAELARDDDLATSGQLHHHLRSLVGAGWLTSTGRGRYAVPAARVVPLLVIVAAAGGP